ncbi:DUF2177 family protein [Gracilibacillus salinarum]|uniref:DUF2177 family protein n=1 Tax=Gracilibacillus salinarum TaxID=2932255 RepID=A0ABY4GRL6_9BACI|nr:DUF2177 family protein [Gracilibacillus salinarum]UOQ86879.1 DUF2177 family protein [Gracilibacillus salinarum]
MIKTRILYILLSYVVYILLDGIWLSVMGPLLYQDLLQGVINTTPPIWQALVFFALYSICMHVLVLDRLQYTRSRLWKAAIFGFVAYGTYGMTNYMTIEEWPRTILIIDIAWGMIVTVLIYLVTSLVYTRRKNV